MKAKELLKYTDLCQKIPNERLSASTVLRLIRGRFSMGTCRMFFLVSIFICIPLFGKKNFECIGLGQVCSTAAALQAFDLRNAAYPFDWTITPFLGLQATLAQEFRDYLNPSHFSIREDNHGIINKYGIVFVHDFPTVDYTGSDIQKEDGIGESVLAPDWLDALPLIQNKYERRINRFIEQCHSKNKIYFFRHFQITRIEAKKLRNTIESLYPKLDFVLVVVGNNQSYAKSWGERRIRNYYLNDTQVWNDVREWKRIFSDLGIIVDTKIAMDSIVAKYESNLCGYCAYCCRKL